MEGGERGERGRGERRGRGGRRVEGREESGGERGEEETLQLTLSSPPHLHLEHSCLVQGV